MLVIHSILRNKMQNVIYSCLMKASSIWSAVLCNYFKPWEKPQQQTCKIMVVFFTRHSLTRHSLTRHSPFVPLCRVDDWLTKWSLEDEVYKSNSFPIHVLSQAVLWVTSWKTSSVGLLTGNEQWITVVITELNVLNNTKYKVQFKVCNKMLIGRNKQW